MKISDELKELLVKELRFSTTRSSGPGGQNVNKLNTQVELRFTILQSKLFGEDEKLQLVTSLKNKINSEGELILTSQEERTQMANKELVIEKFYKVLENALKVKKARIKTTPSPASVIQRLESKKNLALKKHLRKTPDV